MPSTSFPPDHELRHIFQISKYFVGIFDVFFNSKNDFFFHLFASLFEFTSRLQRESTLHTILAVFIVTFLVTGHIAAILVVCAAAILVFRIIPTNRALAMRIEPTIDVWKKTVIFGKRRSFDRRLGVPTSLFSTNVKTVRWQKSTVEFLNK